MIRAAKGLLAIANLLKEIITAKWNIRIIGKKGISRELLSAIEDIFAKLSAGI